MTRARKRALVASRSVRDSREVAQNTRQWGFCGVELGLLVEQRLEP